MQAFFHPLTAFDHDLPHPVHNAAEVYLFDFSGNSEFLRFPDLDDSIRRIDDEFGRDSADIQTGAADRSSVNHGHGFVMRESILDQVCARSGPYNYDIVFFHRHTSEGKSRPGSIVACLIASRGKKGIWLCAGKTVFLPVHGEYAALQIFFDNGFERDSFPALLIRSFSLVIAGEACADDCSQGNAGEDVGKIVPVVLDS